MDGLILGGVNLTDRFDYCMDHFLRLNARRDFRHTYQKAALELMLLGNRLRRWQEAFRGQIWVNTTSEDGHDAMLAFDRIVQTLQDLSTDTESYLPTVSLADFASVTDIICEMMRVKLDKSSRPRSIWQLHDSNAEGKISRIVLYIATLENLSPELAPEIKRLANDEFEELTTEAGTQDLDIFSPFRDISVNEIDPWLQEPIALREESGTANILQLPGAYEPAVAGNAVLMGEREHGSMIGMGVSNVSSRVSQPPRSGRHVSAAQQWDFGTREILHSSHDVTAYELDAMVREQVSIGDPVLTCSLSCEFNSCLNQDLDGSTDLGGFLVITGNVLCAYATTCKDWIKQNWGPVGLSVLEAASEVLEQGRSESPHLSIRLHSDTADGDYLKASIIHPDVADIVKVVQTLVWLAVTFRPLTHNCLHYSSATASLKEGALIISLNGLAPIKPWVPTSCWHHLVGHSIIAGGFYTRVGGYGLELPFPLMLELTSMIYKTDISRLFTAEEEKISSNDDRLAQHFGEVDSTSNFESFESGPGDHRSDNDDHAAEPSGVQVQPTVVDASNVPDVDHSLPEHIESPTTGIFFTGVHSILYPTERSDAMRTLKWHYAESSDVMTPPTNGTWLRLREADLVDKKTILGYTPEVQVKLGTSDRLKQYGKMKRSRAQKEKSAWKLSLEGITIQGGFAGSGVSFPFMFVRRRGQRIAPTAKPTYDQIINQTAEKPVILFDTACKRETAWLISQLSVILDLVLLQASQKKSWQDLGDAGRLALHAKPHWNGGNAAFQVLNDYGRANTVLYRLTDSNKPFAIKHLVTQIFAAMSCRTQIDREYPSRSILSTPPLLGWDLLHLTNTVGVVDRLQVDVQKHFGLNNSPTWLPLAQELPVYFCDNLGDVMTSKVPVCVNMQLGQKYLVASMSALRSRLLNCAESHDWRHWHIDIKGQPMWKVPGPFIECHHGKHEQCEARSRFEEVVQLLVPTRHRCDDDMADHIVGPEEGTVIFGPKRADAPNEV